jgi:hypothetical protein
MSTVTGVDPEPARRNVAFLLKVDGSIRKVDVPLDEDGVPLSMQSMGWRMFMQDMLDLVFTVDGEELPDVPMHMWSVEDTVRLPSKFWNVTCTDPLATVRDPSKFWKVTSTDPQAVGQAEVSAVGQAEVSAVGQSEVSAVGQSEVSVPVQWMVKTFTRPYADPEEFYEKLEFNKCAPLFTTSQYWRGDVLLVCFSENPHVLGPYGRLQEIVSPRELVENIPGALKDFWDVGWQTWRDLQLAFAMATHSRLGTDARACVLDDNLLYMIFDTALKHKFSLQVPEEGWDLRGVFHAMLNEWEDDSENESENEDEDEEGAGDEEEEETVVEDGVDEM